ncbi:MAG: hypothetical protein ACFFDD_06120 [Promethearchaeota archaeon]
MQDIVAIATLLREVSFGILIAGLFYTFGLFALGRIFTAISDHGHIEHDVDHDLDHDIDHEIDHEIGHEVDHDLDHDIGHEVDHDLDHDIDHEIDHEIGHEVDHDLDHDIGHEVDHDLDHDVGHEVDHDIGHDIDHDLDHDIEHDVDHGDIDHDVDHDVEHDHDLDVDHDVPDHKSGFFETERGAPMGVTIGTSLVTFGFLGSLLYYEGIVFPLVAKVAIHLIGVIAIVYTVRTVLRKAFVESGFMIEPRHVVGREVEAVSTINDGFGEVRLETEMGLRRFHARPFQKGVVFQKGTNLFIVSADNKFVYVDPRRDVVKWLQKQSRIKQDEPKSRH